MPEWTSVLPGAVRSGNSIGATGTLAVIR